MFLLKSKRLFLEGLKTLLGTFTLNIKCFAYRIGIHFNKTQKKKKNAPKIENANIVHDLDCGPSNPHNTFTLKDCLLC